MDVSARVLTNISAGYKEKHASTDLGLIDEAALDLVDVEDGIAKLHGSSVRGCGRLLREEFRRMKYTLIVIRYAYEPIIAQ